MTLVDTGISRTQQLKLPIFVLFKSYLYFLMNNNYYLLKIFFRFVKFNKKKNLSPFLLLTIYFCRDFFLIFLIRDILSSLHQARNTFTLVCDLYTYFCVD